MGILSYIRQILNSKLQDKVNKKKKRVAGLHIIGRHRKGERRLRRFNRFVPVNYVGVH